MGLTKKAIGEAKREFVIVERPSGGYDIHRKFQGHIYPIGFENPKGNLMIYTAPREEVTASYGVLHHISFALSFRDLCDRNDIEYSEQPSRNELRDELLKGSDNLIVPMCIYVESLADRVDSSLNKTS